MKLNLKSGVQKKIFIISVSLIIVIVAYLVLTRMNDIFRFLGNIISILTPFILGFGIAFLLNGPVGWLENRLMRFNWKKKTCKGLAVTLVFLFFILCLILILWIVIPSLVDSLRTLVANFSTYTTRFEDTIYEYCEKWDLDVTQIEDFFAQLNIAGTLSDWLHNSLTTIMSYSIDIVQAVANFVIACAAAVYMLLDKEKLLHGQKQLTYSIFGKNTGNFFVLYSMDAKNVFQQYIVGNILDSLIVGLVCWFCCMILGIPYSPMIGLIVGITNVIPVFGPFLGAIPVILLLLIIDPMDALIFAVLILIIQQVDGNVLKPLILGDKLGINGFWILFSVSIGGSLFGAVGMFLGVPVFALIYEWIKDYSRMQLAKKHLEIPVHSGVIE